MAQQVGPVKKVYELSTVGYDSVLKQLQEIAQGFTKIRKAKEELIKLKARTEDPAELARINEELRKNAIFEKSITDQIQQKIEARKKELELQNKLNSDSSTGSKTTYTDFVKQKEQAIQSYNELNQAYQASKKVAQDMAAQFGVESEEAKEATASMRLYKEQLDSIKNSLKAKPAETPQPAAIQVPPEIAATALAYDTYTGSIQANLTALIENEAALAANKAEQKALGEAITATGAPTEAQTLRMVQLREEAALLANKNKDLSVTLNNQVKEFNGAAGSIDQMQAQLNNLQNAYERLSVSEREAPFGLELKKEIDQLEPKVKELEASLGRFNRNVGHYPKGSLLDLKAEVKELTDQYNKLTAAERDSQKGVGLQGQIGKVTEELGQLEKKSGNVFNKVFGYLRGAANFLPGIGLSGIVLALITPIQAIGSKLYDFSLNSFGAGKSLDDLKQKAKDSTEAFEGAAKGFEDAYSQIANLTNQVKLAKEGFIDKNKVVKEYNETIGKATEKVTDLDGVEQALVKNGPAYVNMMLYKAAATFALQKASEKAFEAATIARKKESEFANFIDVNPATAFGGNALTLDQIRQQNKILEDARKERQKKQVDDANKEKDNLESIANDFQAQAAKIAKDNKFDFFGGQFDDKKDLKEKTDSLSAAEQNAIKLIDSFNALALIRENKRVADIRKVRDLTTDEEIDHLKNLQQINQNYDEQRIRAVVGNNTAEQKYREEHGLKIVTDQIETSDKIKAIKKKEYDDTIALLKKQFDDESALLKERLDSGTSNAELDNQTVQQSPAASETQKAISQKDFDDTEIQRREKYFADLEEAAVRNKQSLEKIEAAKNKELNDLKRKGLLDDANITKAYLKDIDTDSENVNNKRLIEDGAAITKLYENRKLTTQQREDELKKIKVKYDADELKRLQDLAKKEIPILKALYDSQLISVEEYYKKLKALQDAIANAAKNKSDDSNDNNNIFTTGAFNVGEGLQGLNGSLEAYLKIDPNSVAGNIIGNSFQFADEAMSAYFTSEQNHIVASLKLAEKRLDIETKQRLARSQSQAEDDAINAEADKKKEDLERKAFEDNKKLQKKQAAIAFAVQLENIAAGAAANPLAGPTFGAATLIQIAVLSSLAAARYALNLSTINSQQFATGGKVQPLPNGLITMRSNIPVQRNGDSVLATVRPGEVILNEFQQRLLGGAATFKRVGVPGFNTGGLVSKNAFTSFNAFPEAPIYTAGSYLSNPANDKILATLQEQAQAIQETAEAQQEHAKAIQAVSDQLLTLQVQVSDKDITNAQDKAKRQASVGTLGTKKRA